MAPALAHGCEEELDRLDHPGRANARDDVERVLGAGELGVEDRAVGGLAQPVDEGRASATGTSVSLVAVEDQERRRVRRAIRQVGRRLAKALGLVGEAAP